ncbi:MAG TPA: UbiD family decarboxylase [Dehalococcoidia bacterium]|nr:UbiD family decarboxylase [Dehalococcoidia bacterium]
MGKYYRDLREHLKRLEELGKLQRISTEINKDTELMPLVRWQFRGLPESERKAFMFDNVVDSRGRKYSVPVAVANHAASTDVYAIGMMCEPDEIQSRWTAAQKNPISSIVVAGGPAQDEVHTGEELKLEGLDEFPIPISTPGFDPAPFLTAANWITKDPETGTPNIGNYRAQVKARNRTGLMANVSQHLMFHWRKARSLGEPLEAAAVIGAAPCVGYVAVSKVPYGMDELAIAGGLAGEPLQVVRCKTVNIEVPATAEIVLEGIISTQQVEPEAPFGEYTGYMGGRTTSTFFEITCITHRKNPIYNAFISQFPPSESSKIRQIGYQSVMYNFLRYGCNIPTVTKVALLESGGSNQYVVVQMKKENPAQPWQALNAVAGMTPSTGKLIVVVDEDIDPFDADSVNWALSFRMQPHRDIRFTEGKMSALDPSAAPPGSDAFQTVFPNPNGTSAVLIDATRKWDFPPVSLPAKEYMERARDRWQAEGLPQLSVKAPWYGYSLGNWTAENEEEAAMAVRGDYYATGEKLAARRVNADRKK